MKDSENISFQEISQNLLNMILILGSLSAFLFLVGYLNYATYYKTLGIASVFLDFSYYEYVLNGFIESLFVVGWVTFCAAYYWTFYRIRKSKKVFSTLKKRITDTGDEDLKKEIPNLENLISEYEELEKNGLHRIGKVVNIIFPSVFLIAIIATYFLYHLNESEFYFVLLTFDLSIFLGYVIMLLFKRLTKTKDFVFELLLWSPYFLFIFILPPILSGYLEAKSSLKSVDFSSYTVELSSKTIDNVQFVYFGKDNYFFFIDGELNIITKNQVIALKKN